MGSSSFSVGSFFSGGAGQVSGLPLEALLFFLCSTKKRVCVEVDRNTIENISVLLQKDIGSDVGCILKPKDLLVDFENFYNKISALSVQALCGGGNLRLCFIEEQMLKLPCIPTQASSGFKIDRSCSFEQLLKKLEFLGFSQTGSLPTRGGSFYVNGGVVDILLFNVGGFYRVSFLDDWCSVYLVDLKTNNIKKSVASLLLLPFANKALASPESFFKKGWRRALYKNGVFLNKDTKGELTQNINIQGVDYQRFRADFSKNKKIILPFSCERGFLFGSSLYIPLWFNQKGLSLEKTSSRVLDGLAALTVGSLYVHEDFGLCQFLGLEMKKKQERVCLKFLDGVVKLDVYYISRLSFFSHNTDHKLNFLNRPGAWKRKKQKAKKEAQEYVKHIISSYSTREEIASIPLGVSDPIIKEFVKNFKHKDTQDQALCWKEVLKDLGNNRPMNRLVCGDVGFGKTEIALRAAFVSVLGGQQVVVLAPTTILANQLFHSFVSRLGAFGVSVGALSGFSLKKTTIVDRFIKKKLDVLVGTSSLLFRPQILKQCGLFIVDEEHRFGVKDKELVLSLNPPVNFLSLSATPIPRSLQLSLNSVRSLSTIQTPPIERKPIISFVHYFDVAVICGAILREVGRGGQVFLVDNSVENLKKLLKIIKSKLPAVSLGVIYSRLNKKEIIKTMDSFVFGKTQVLLSTSIIESGIDIGQANTIIINNSHLFGLSQLYQLRGRVGRSPLQAFAWFLIPQKKQTTGGKKRLKTIIKNAALGSGYYIALSDLDIRGAGSLFGYKQSGDGGVGFELYSKLVGLALNKERSLDCVVDIYNSSLAPVVGDEGQRGYFYKCVFAAQTKKDLDQIKKDFINIFGCCPEEFLCLLKNREIGLLARKKGVNKIIKNNSFIVVVFAPSQKELFVARVLPYVVSFFKKNNLVFRFLRSEKKLTFQYKSVGENDYILLLSFIKGLSF